MQWEVVVVGAGAAGLFAAMRAAECGRRVLLIEKNRRPGVKILISGGTRCNLTHNTDARGIVAAYGKQGPFLYSALAALSPRDVVDLVEAEGVPTYVEPNGKVFPRSDRATDVLAALLARLGRTACTLSTDESLVDLSPVDGGFELKTSQRTLTAQKVIVTTGGLSYPGCGTTGDAYPWAIKLGHTLAPTRPALVPITSNAAWVQSLTGIAVQDTQVRVLEPPKAEARQATAVALAARREALLFTHFGVSGPAALDVSREVSGHAEPQRLLLECDFLPTLSATEFDTRLQAAAKASGKKQLLAVLPEAVLPDELPKRLLQLLLEAAGVLPETRIAELTKLQRAATIAALKAAKLPVCGTRGYKKAEVTAGGVSLSEVDSRTMESKLVPGLYWAGEVLDLDGRIGGFNFQAAFSTGWLAGQSV